LWASQTGEVQNYYRGATLQNPPAKVEANNSGTSPCLSPADPEVQLVRARYDRRLQTTKASLYTPTTPYNLASAQERERAIVAVLQKAQQFPVASKRVLEVGCGGGSNLRQLVDLGFRPENLVGNELLDERVLEARSSLPASIHILPGDARLLPIEPQSLDIVYQSTVFSSILDQDFRRELAATMWNWVRPGGGILWYDFLVNNPRNPDVRRVPISEVATLFPAGDPLTMRTTLAPPIGRRLVRHHGLYGLLNVWPLRTHAVIFIRKD
jgi:SAM-dependent methyltransferase